MALVRSEQSSQYLDIEKQKFYHYCKISTQTFDNIYNNKLYLSHPTTFNDPYDSKLKISNYEIDSVILKLVSEYLIDQTNDYDVINSFSYDSLMEYFSTSKNEIAPPFTESINFILLSNNEKLNELSNLYKFFETKGIDDLFINDFFSIYLNMGILCLSKSFYSPQMWSYYADDHKGMCIEYDINEDNLNEYYLKNVVYSNNNIDTINISAHYDKEIFIDQIIDQICHKSTDWCHEKEVRLVSTSHKGLINNPGIITGICFGLRTSESDINVAKNLFKDLNPNIELYKATTNDSYYVIDWKSLNGFLPCNQRSYSELPDSKKC